MDNPPEFIHLFFRQFWRILKMDYPSETDNPSLVWKRQLKRKTMFYLLTMLWLLIYYTNANEIPGELSRKNKISSQVKITCYLHMWKDHHCYGYQKKEVPFAANRFFSEMVWYFIGVYIINKTFITWPLGDTDFLFLCFENYFSTHGEKFLISARPCNILDFADFPLNKIFDNLCKIEPRKNQQCTYRHKNEQSSSTGVWTWF